MAKQHKYRPAHWHTRYYDPLQRSEEPDRQTVKARPNGPRCVRSIRHQKSADKHSERVNPYRSTVVIVRVCGGAERGFPTLKAAQQWLRKLPTPAVITDSTGTVVGEHKPHVRSKNVPLKAGKPPARPTVRNDNPSLFYGV